MALQRILEPEVMDSAKEAQEYNDMDHSAVNKVFVADLLAYAMSVDAEEEFALGDVIDLGTGTALIPIELCKTHESCRVMAVDLAAHMLDLAKYNVQVAGLEDRVSLAQIDAKEMPFDSHMFDVSMSNSIIHHIADPLSSLKEMVRVTQEDGIVFVRDLMRPETQEEIDQLVMTYTGEETEYSQKLFRDSLHASLSLDEICEMVEELGYDSDSVTATTDRHWTWATIR
ncbi:MAG: class I SAM-dependent methyltransferase [Mariniblastus sp.]